MRGTNFHFCKQKHLTQKIKNNHKIFYTWSRWSYSLTWSHMGKEIFLCHVLVFSHFRQLDHPNLMAFWGACVKLPNVMILTKYCAKGNLLQVLSAKHIPLNWAFRLVEFCLYIQHNHTFTLCWHCGHAYANHSSIIHICADEVVNHIWQKI